MDADNSGGGRPTKYEPKYAKQAQKLCRLGATDRELADFFEVSVSTICLWRVEHQEFSDSTKVGKAVADAVIERSLYQRAKGYSHDAVKIMSVSIGDGMSEIREIPFVQHYPPDPTSMIFWLKNRRPKTWRDRQEVEQRGDVVVRVEGGLPEKEDETK